MLLASEYTTLNTPGLCQIGWELKSCNDSAQNSNSVLAPTDNSSKEHHADLAWSSAYMLLVINLDIGPSANPIAIIFPIRLARRLALSTLASKTAPRFVLSTSTFLTKGGSRGGGGGGGGYSPPFLVEHASFSFQPRLFRYTIISIRART